MGNIYENSLKVTVEGKGKEIAKKVLVTFRKRFGSEALLF